MAAPSTKPLRTSQKADDAKPEKIAFAGAARVTVASKKNNRAVGYSGNHRVAHDPIVRMTIAEATMII